MTNDSVDWFKACLVYGIPFGIPYMFSVIPIGGDAARSVCILVVNIIVGAVFGCLIAGVVFIRSVIYSISYFVQKICKLF